jgi:hypothetical protein
MRVQGDAPRELHVLSPEVFLCRKRIMGPAPELEIVERLRPAERVRTTMVNLEPERFATSLPALVPVGASLAIALEHRTP